jgi:hypothetical protein
MLPLTQMYVPTRVVRVAGSIVVLGLEEAEEFAHMEQYNLEIY